MTSGHADRTRARSRCGRCGADYEASVFADLVPVRTLARAELAEHVVHWPEGTVIDVRRCARCQTPIARLSRPLS